MSFESTSYFEFTGSDENKPIKPEFKDKTFRAIIGMTKNKSGSCLSIRWQIVKWSNFDNKRALLYQNYSLWKVGFDSLVHEHPDTRTKKQYDPDSLVSPFIFNQIVGIHNNELTGTAACEFLLELFDHTEVDLLNESSIFCTEFPKFFKHRKTIFDRRKSKIVKNALDT